MAKASQITIANHVLVMARVFAALETFSFGRVGVQHGGLEGDVKRAASVDIVTDISMR